MAGRFVERKVKRNFLGDGQVDLYRKGQIVAIPEQKVTEYENAGLVERAAAAPTKEAAAASLAADKASKAAKPGETKESTGKDGSGLEPWTQSISEEAYVSRYDGKDNSVAVGENLKLAKARIKAGVSSGAKD